MLPHELLHQVHANFQTFCHALQHCSCPRTLAGLLWRVGQHATFQVTVSAKLPAAAVLPVPTGVVPPLLITEYVTAETGAKLRTRGVCYLDLAGNAWLQHPASELFIFVQGRPRCKRPAAGAGAAFRAEGLRVLFAGLTHPLGVGGAAAPPRALARVLADLQAQDLLDPRTQRLRGSPGLAARWVAAYGPVLRRRLNPQRYRWLDPAGARAAGLHALLGQTGAWSGERGAQLLLGDPAAAAAPDRLVLYTAADRGQLSAQLGLAPHKHGPVELLVPFASSAPTEPCAHPLLVYADLLLLGTDAAQALAERLAQQFLAELLPAPGGPG